MAQEQKKPLAVRGATWYNQYQETNLTLDLPAGKAFAPAKRLSGLTPQKILTQVTNIYRSYVDVNENESIDKNKTWFTLGTAAATVIKADINFAWSGNLNNGQTVSIDVNRGDILADDVLGIQGSAGIQNINGIPFGVGIVTSIPTAGTARVQLVNNTGNNYTGLNTSLTVRHFQSVQALGAGIYNYGMRKGSPVTAEFAENGYPVQKVEQGFQEFYNINESVYSDMQNIWDIYRKKSKMNLIVSGSIYSLMQKIFQNKKEPLFGRADNIIKLNSEFILFFIQFFRK